MRQIVSRAKSATRRLVLKGCQAAMAISLIPASPTMQSRQTDAVSGSSETLQIHRLRMTTRPEMPTVVKQLAWVWHHTQVNRELLMRGPVLGVNLFSELIYAFIAHRERLTLLISPHYA